MSLPILRHICLTSDGMYETVELNSNLRLQYYGFTKIAALESFTALRALCLSHNSLTCIEGLETCTQLQSLDLSHNKIKVIEGLSSLQQLAFLDLSSNLIRQIQGLSDCRSLSQLVLARNELLRGFHHLATCTQVNRLDLSDCSLADAHESDLAQMTSLTSVLLKGNPCTRGAGYRRRVVATAHQLSVGCVEHVCC
jgi:Leucine-rich repeat (LRR) protein